MHCKVGGYLDMCRYPQLPPLFSDKLELCSVYCATLIFRAGVWVLRVRKRPLCVYMSDSNADAERNDSPATDNHPALLDCCGGLNNVDYSKVKVKPCHRKLFRVT